MACNTACPPGSIVGREAGFLGQILLVDRAEQHGLSVDFWGSIRCALAPKLCARARAHEISKTHKSFGEISLDA